MEDHRRFPTWFRLAMVCSGTACTILLMQTSFKWSFCITAALSLALLVFLVFRVNLAERLLASRPLWACMVAGILSLATVYRAKSTFYTFCAHWMEQAVRLLGLPQIIIRLMPWIMALLALPMVMSCLLWFVNLMGDLAVRLCRSSDFTERMYFLGAGLLFTMMIVFTYLCTQAFFGAYINGWRYDFDLIYSADSGYLVRTDVFRNIGADQNDLRQPLFGLFATPFSQTAWLISKLLFFLPVGYITIWQILQMLMFLTSVILISRMMELKGAEKALFLSLFSVSYPMLIFVLTAEQYLVAMFYFVLLLYLRREERGKTMAFVGASGCLMTSGLWFPLITWDRDLKQFIKKSFRLLGVFLAVLVLSGRLTTYLDMPSYAAGFAPYIGYTVAPMEKLLQYVNFAGACLLAPPSGIDTTMYSHISWQMLPVTGWSPVGLAVIALTIGGFLISRKERFSRWCAAWAGFSFLLLGLVGWGTVDNGLMLYTLYFGWAIICLVFRFIDRILNRVRPAKVAVLMAAILAVAACNIYALRNVLIFATQFFPTLGGIR